MSYGGRTRSGAQYQQYQTRCVIWKDDDTQCKSKYNFDHRGRCMFAHKDFALPGEPQCKGKTKDGEDCRREPKSGSSYCSPQHNPKKELVDPAMFRIGGLRKDREHAIARRDKSKDIYTSFQVVTTDRVDVELDHVLEMQIINVVFYSATSSVADGMKMWLTEVLKPVVNGNGNLGLTTKTINRNKQKAVKEFLDHEPLSATRQQRPHLRACLGDCIRSYDVVDEILRRLQDAYEFVKGGLQAEVAELRSAQEYERVLQRFIEELDRMAKAMGLAGETPPTSVTAPTRPSRLAPTVKTPVEALEETTTSRVSMVSTRPNGTNGTKKPVVVEEETKPSPASVASTSAKSTTSVSVLPPSSPRPSSRRESAISPPKKTKVTAKRLSSKDE